MDFEGHSPLFHQNTKKNTRNPTISGVNLVAGVGLEPHDLRVMSPTSYQLLYPAILLIQRKWCRKPGSNRYAIFITQDFKSRASANSAIPALSPAVHSLGCLYIISYSGGVVKPFFIIFSPDSQNGTNPTLQKRQNMIS